ncbi:MAG TPA: hypothetical protein VL380_09480 [Nitrosospira sp.]|nr:hypothetical protein [Nitrosospira sp.]
MISELALPYGTDAHNTADPEVEPLAQLQQAHLLRQFQHLHKDARQFVQKAPPERG